MQGFYLKKKKKKDHFASHVCSCHVLTLYIFSSTTTGTYRTSLSTFLIWIPPWASPAFPISPFLLPATPKKDTSNNTPHSLLNVTNFQQLFCTSDPRSSLSFSRTSSNQPETDSFLTPLFSSLHFSHTNSLWNLLIPKWHYLVNQH